MSSNRATAPDLSGISTTQRLQAWMLFLALGIAAVVSIVASTGFQDVPRFDGAGYAMLSLSILEGEGYRSLDDPARPLHGHFPPGYPGLLAALWHLFGVSVPAAHALSIVLTTAAVVLAWLGFRRGFDPPTATALGFALSINWMWARVGGSIQSEPLFLFLTQAALIATPWAASPGHTRAHSALRAIALGMLLGAGVLTRTAGVAFLAAVSLELLWRRRWVGSCLVNVGFGLAIAPWAAWLAYLRRAAEAGTPDLIHYIPRREHWLQIIAENAAFYIQRLPDALTGPYIEIGTIFAPRYAALAWTLAGAGSFVLLVGWIAALRSPTTRLAGLVVAANLLMLLPWPYTEAGRFLIPIIPSLLVVATHGIAVLLSYLPVAQLGSVEKCSRLAACLLLATALPYAAYAAASGRAEAQRGLHKPLDSACLYLAELDRAGRSRRGPVLSDYPGEVFWYTHRPGRPAPPTAAAADVESLADRLDAAYVLVVANRFARARQSPLERFVAERPGRVRLVHEAGEGTARLYEITPPPDHKRID